MKPLMLIIFWTISYPFLRAQEASLFDMKQHRPLFSKRIQFSYFYADKESIDTAKMNADLQRISKQYLLSDTVLIKEIYYELHVKPICHKIVNQISPDLWKEEKKNTNDFTDMTPWSGRIFIHVANLNLNTGTLTRRRYDIDIAMVLLDERTGKHYYYLANCADTPLPFIWFI